MQMVMPIHMNGRFNYRQEALAFRAQKIAEAKEAAAVATIDAIAKAGRDQQ
jgi:hypothetical protein